MRSNTKIDASLTAREEKPERNVQVVSASFRRCFWASSAGCPLSDDTEPQNSPADNDAGIISPTECPKHDLDDVDENGIPKQFTALSEVVRKINSARDGNPVDMDGDGYPELTVETDENGVKTVTLDKYGDVYFVSESKPGEYVHTLQDTNGDGMTDIQWDRFPEREVWQYDRDYDGYPEEIKTITYDFENQKVHERIQRDLDGDGNYEYDETETGDAPELVKDEPDKAKATKATTKHLQINIAPGGCADADDEEGIKRAHGVLYAALNCAIGDGLNCLRETNRSMYNSAMQYLSSGGTLSISCNERIVGHAKTTKVYVDWFESKILFKSSKVFEGCEASNWEECFTSWKPYFCNIMLHEFLHAVGYELGTPSHDSESKDEVYSCGRYCGHCSNDLKNAPGFPNRDCARCGGTIEEKMQCGHVEKVKIESCPDIYNVCHDGLGCISDACEECTELYGFTCAEDVSEDLSYPDYVYVRNNFLCCNACPNTCNASNDFTCLSTTQLEDTCHQPLPMCNR